MKIRHNVPIYSICWLNHTEGGIIGTFYEPENLDELKDICASLYHEGKQFDLIGHTSNIYFLPNYNIDYMVSTRKCNQYRETDNEIICDCGVSVMKLARKMVNERVKGFEGLIDLPGTVGASVYGNASCYSCSINSLLISCDLLQPNGEILTITPRDLLLSKRSTTLKRRELQGVLLSIKLRKEKGNMKELVKLAEENHQHRRLHQPGPKDNLGSIYGISGGWSCYSIIPRTITNLYGFLIGLLEKDTEKIKQRKKIFLFTFLGAKDLLPYVYGWNRYIWKDEKSHELFWKYHRLHQRLFNKSIFEIEIKGKK